MYALYDMTKKFGMDAHEFVLDRLQNNNGFVFLGDEHGVTEYDAFLLRLIPDLGRLKQSLYLEMEETQQPAIDRYLNTGSELDLEKVIQRQRELVAQDIPVSGRLEGPYFDVIRAARRYGVCVVAIDVKDVVSDDDIEHRNRHMAHQLVQPGVVYVGWGHLLGEDGIVSIVKAQQTQTFSVFPDVETSSRRKLLLYPKPEEIGLFAEDRPLAFDFSNIELYVLFVADYYEQPTRSLTPLNVFKEFNAFIYHQAAKTTIEPAPK